MCWIIFHNGKRKYISVSAAPVFNSAKNVIGAVATFEDVTEKKISDERFAQEAYKNEMLLQTASDGICITDRKGKIILANESFAKITGYAADELAQKYLSDLGVKAPIERFEKGMESLSGGGNIIQSKYKRKNGETVEVEINPKYVEIGNESFVYASVRDVTQRKQQETEREAVGLLSGLFLLQKSNSDLFQIAAKILAEKFEFPIAGILLYNSAAKLIRYVGIYGIHDESMPKNKPLEKSIAEESIITGKPFVEYNISCNKKLQKTYWAGKGVETVIVVPIKNDKEIIGAVILADTKEHKQHPAISALKVAANQIALGFTQRAMVEQLQESEQKFRKLFTESTNGIAVHEIITDEQNKPIDYRFLSVNPAYETMTGIKRDAVIGKTVKEIMPGGETFLIETYGRTAVTGIPISFERYSEEAQKYYSISVFQNEERQFTVLLQDITEQKISEQEKEIASQQRDAVLAQMRLILENMPIGCFLTTSDIKVTYWNKEAEKIYGYTAEEIIHKNPLDFIIKNEDKELFVRHYNLAAEKNIVLNKQSYGITKAGETIFCNWHAVALRDSSGNIIGYLGMAHDITKMQESEQSIRKLSRAVEQSSASVIITDNNGSIEYVNSAFEKITGYTLDEVLGENPRILQSGLTPADVYEDLWRTVTAGATWNGILCNKKKSGDIFWENVTIFPVLDDSGARTNYIAIKEDISDRKKIEKELAGAEERYRKFFNEDITGDFIAQPDGTITLCNNSFAKMFGFVSVQDAMQKNLFELFADKNFGILIPDILRKKKKIEYQEAEGISADGKQVFFIYTISADFNSFGELTELKGYMLDNTERRMAEHQLRQTQKMDSIGKLAGGIAHDFNNIVNNVLGFTAQIKKYSHDQAKVLRYAATIEKSAARGADLAVNLLSIYKHKKREDAPIAVADVVQEISTVCVETFPKHISVNAVLDPNVGCVKGDRSSIYQILLNLTVNARDAMQDETKKGTLTIRAERRRMGEEVHPQLVLSDVEYCTVLTISDTGMGMSNEVQEHIFEPFFTTKEKGKGTGLGLSVVYSIVKEHKGTIWVTSESGVGSTFTVYLPETEPDKVKGKKMEIKKQGNNQIILLVDDEEDMQNLGREILEEAGYKVLIAENGFKAVDIYKERGSEIACVVLDFVMPRMDGAQTYLELRKLNKKIKAVFCTGFTPSDVMTYLLESEHLTAIKKPFDLEEFVARVEEVLYSER